MFTLNMLFDFFGHPRGRFNPAAGALPLNQSVNWLQLQDPEPANPNPPTFNPETANWLDLGLHGTLLIPNFNPAPGAIDPANIAMRLAPDPTARPLPATATLQLILSFGRPVIAARTPQSSPFTDAAGSVKTAFVFGPTTRNTSAGWFFPVGTVALRPPQTLPSGAAVGPVLTDRYEFSIGAIVTVPGTGGAPSVVRYYGEDPEMDIGQ